MKGRIKHRRNNLYKKNPNCHWCGVLTILPEKLKGKGRYNIPIMATVDHIYSRNHPLRNTPQLNPYEERTVLSCLKCNNERGEIKIEIYEKIKKQNDVLPISKRA